MTPAPIETLAVELQRQLATKRDLIAHTPSISVAADEPGQATLNVDLADGAEGFGINPYAHRQLATTLDLPQKTYDRLLDKHPSLYVHLVNGLFIREPGKHLIRLMDGNDFHGIEFKECALTDTRMYVKLFLPGWEIPVTPKVGDVIRGGAVISNSEVGAGSLYIYPYTDRLICTNGAIHTDFGQRRIHVGSRIASDSEAYELYSDDTMRLDDEAFFAKCSDTLRACLNQQVFEAIAAQMRDLAEITMPGSPVEAVKELAQTQRFTQDEGDSILRHIVEGGDLSAWGFVNGITATARDLDDADRRAELEIRAGRLIANHEWALA